MVSHLELDVRDLEAPEPLQKVLGLIEQLAEGQYLHVIHRREAHCMRQLIGELGFDHRLTNVNPRFDIWIWRHDDKLAALAAQEAASG